MPAPAFDERRVAPPLVPTDRPVEPSGEGLAEGCAGEGRAEEGDDEEPFGDGTADAELVDGVPAGALPLRELRDVPVLPVSGRFTRGFASFFCWARINCAIASPTSPTDAPTMCFGM